jgi:GTP pyrophosphokinase
MNGKEGQASSLLSQNYDMNKISIQYDEQRFTDSQREGIEGALSYATIAHKGQTRRSGEPYVTHPVAVAETVALWGLDHEAVMAALLHDVVEDTPITTLEIEAIFGPNVAQLVDGVTKLAAIEALAGAAGDNDRLESTNENLRKLLLATAKDFRVILIKLADRLHNLRTLSYLSPEKRLRIAKESLDVFAPLADRLGMGQLKCEIEDLSFEYLLPDEFARLSSIVNQTTSKAEQYISELKHSLVTRLGQANVQVVSVDGRQKHLYSVYKKMVKVNGDIDKIYDLIAIRIIVPDVASCYQALGIIHQLYKPLIYRIKDYIAVPKPNGYQSLHTTVFADEGRITEIQIRTPQMHEEAEHGLSAHFYYDAQKSSGTYAKGQHAGTLPDKLKWVGQLAQIQAAVGSGQEFVDSAKLELFGDRIFVFSPRGDLYDLPEDATPIDFAFAIHTNIGLRAMGARVNNRMATLDTRLENRDVVEIITRREPAPNRDWLSFVKTPHARNRIRAWFRASSRETNIVSGRSLLEAELKIWGMKRLEDVPVRQLVNALDALHQKNADDMLAAIGDGSIGVIPAIRRLVPDAARPAATPVIKRVQSTGHVKFEGGIKDLPYALAPCCQPFFPQPIIGYVTRGSGVTVHSFSCRNLPVDSERYVTCSWETLAEIPERLVCRLQLVAFNRIGMLSYITGAISRRNYRIGSVNTHDIDETRAQIEFVIEVPDLFALADIIKRLELLPGIESVKRV